MNKSVHLTRHHPSVIVRLRGVTAGLHPPLTAAERLRLAGGDEHGDCLNCPCRDPGDEDTTTQQHGEGVVKEINN
jgi:hypothetical protein